MWQAWTTKAGSSVGTDRGTSGHASADAHLAASGLLACGLEPCGLAALRGGGLGAAGACH